jgi:predicted small integral membrane protein
MSEIPDFVVAAPVEPTEPRRRGFLPIETNAFDRVFIGVVTFVAIHLLWMRFAEPLGLSLYVATALSVLLGALIVARG